MRSKNTLPLILPSGRLVNPVALAKRSSSSSSIVVLQNKSLFAFFEIYIILTLQIGTTISHNTILESISLNLNFPSF
jgi:hypothetical protein